MLFFAPLFTAAAVSYEKDRRTFTLLLMTDLSDLEIVLGKLVAGLLNILMILAASIGLVSLCVLFGGISFGQVVNLFAVTAASGVAGGALGLLIALWRDRTFQSISLTILMVVFSVTGVEVFAILFPNTRVHGRAAGAGPESLSRDAGGPLSRERASSPELSERRAWSISVPGSRSRPCWLPSEPGCCGCGTRAETSRASCAKGPRSRRDRIADRSRRGAGPGIRPGRPRDRRRHGAVAASAAGSGYASERLMSPSPRERSWQTSEADGAAGPARRDRRPDCTYRDELIAGSRPRPSDIASRGPTRSSGASS